MDSVDVPNKYEAKLEAERIVVDFIKACQKLDLDELSDAELQSQVLDLKRSAEKHNNPFVKMLLEE